MRPFDIELAKKGHKVVTRIGRNYKFIGVFEELGELCVIGLAERIDNGWDLIRHGKNGQSNIDRPYIEYTSSTDLFMSEPEYWVNIYEDRERLSDPIISIVSNRIYPNCVDAISDGVLGAGIGVNYKYIETVKITPTNTLK
jgi:hypothetical protein